LALVNRGIAGFSALALLVAQLAPAFAQQRPQQSVTQPRVAVGGFSRGDYEVCQTTEEITFRKAI